MPSLSYEWLCTTPRFDREAYGNSEMALLEVLSHNLKSDTCFETQQLTVTQLEHFKEPSRTLKFRSELNKGNMF